MALDDQEKRSGEARFEEALARHLRREAMNDGGRGAASCPDAETLAAYHERSLAHEEMHSWKEHIAACARCQEILSTLELTDHVHAGVHEDEEGVAAFLEPVAAAAAPMRAAAHGVSPEAFLQAAAIPAKHMQAQPRAPYWRWLAPAGAIAAVLLLWVAVRNRPVQGPPAEPSVMVAQNRTAPSAAPAEAVPPAKVVESVPAPETRGIEKKSLNSGQPDAEMQSRTASSNDALKEQAKKGGGAAGGILDGTFGKLSASSPDDENVKLPAGAAAGQAAPYVAPKDVPPPGVVAGLRERNSDQSIDSRKADSVSKKKSSDLYASQNRPAPAKAGASASAARSTEVIKIETTAVAPVAESAEGEKQKPAAAPSAAPAPFAARKESSKALAREVSYDGHLILAPGSAVQWSVGPSGLIHRSADGGKTWTTQQSGIAGDLTAGSAPSDTVCWVVGAKGTILLTTDGEHWTKIHSPTSADLIGVAAQDARNAAVWSDSREPRYVTQDGGQTWKLRAVE
jgi:hypothetical protein